MIRYTWNLFVTQCNTNVVKVHHYKCKPSLQVRRYYLLCLFLAFASFGHLSAQLHAALSASAYFGCPPLTVQFTDISTGGPHTDVLDMGNSNTAVTLPATTTYFQPGAYTVILRITNGTSTDSAILTIRVFAPPIDSLLCCFFCSSSISDLLRLYWLKFTLTWLA